jgi:ribosomal protein S18 acetylase RimI-like enzyme
VHPENERALKLYTSRGFRIIGKHGKEHMMELILDEGQGGKACTS